MGFGVLFWNWGWLLDWWIFGSWGFSTPFPYEGLVVLKVGVMVRSDCDDLGNFLDGFVWVSGFV